MYGALLLQTAISAGTYLTAKYALAYLGWPALVMLRNLGGAALLAALVMASPGPAWPPRPVARRVLLLGLLVIPLNQSLFIAGLAYTTPAHASLMYTLTPLFVLLLSVLTKVERLEGPKVVGVALALAGAAMVVLERSAGASSEGPRHGDLLILAAVVAWALYTVLGRRLVHEHGPLKATAWSMIAGTVMFLPVGAPAMARVAPASLPAGVWAALAFLVVFTSVVSYLAWSYALRWLVPSRVAVFSNLQPVVTAALSWALFSEPITLRLAAGGGLVILGVLVATRRRGEAVR